MPSSSGTRHSEANTKGWSCEKIRHGAASTNVIQFLDHSGNLLFDGIDLSNAVDLVLDSKH